MVQTTLASTRCGPSMPTLRRGAAKIARRVHSRVVHSTDDNDRGAALAEFVMICILQIFLLFAVIEVALVFWARTVVAVSTSDAARYAAGSNLGPQVATDRVRSEIESALGGKLASGITCVADVETDDTAGVRFTVVHCTGNLRSTFLPVGSFIRISTTARALTEPAS